MAAGKDGTVMATAPSDSRDRTPSHSFPAKQASPSQYIDNPRQHIRTDMDDIKYVVFASLYSKEWEMSAAKMTTVSEGDIGGRIPKLSATPENIQSVRSGVVCHGGIE